MGDEAPGRETSSSGENWRKMLKFLKIAEKVAVRVRPSFDKNKKHVGLGKIIYCLSPDIHAFCFCSNLGRTQTNKTTFSAVLRNLSILRQFSPEEEASLPGAASPKPKIRHTRT